MGVAAFIFGFSFLAGGVAFAQSTPVDLAPPVLSAESSSAVKIAPSTKTNIVYFYSETCIHCKNIKPLLKDIEKKYGDTVIFRRYEVRISQAARTMFAKFLAAYGVPDGRGGTPTIMIGDTALIGEDEVKERLESIVQYCRENACPLKAGLDDQVGGFKKRDIPRAEDSADGRGTVTLPIVFGAAVIDSINPCAIGVLLLLIGFLLTVHGSRKRLAWLGSLYILAVFVTYLLAGVGILHLIGIFNLAALVKGIAAAVLLAAAALSLKEFFAPGSTFLRIPDRAKGMLTRWLTKGSVAGVLIAGFLVSAVELPCTGEVYLGILSLLSDGMDRARGFWYLAMYNLIFVAPLIIILALALFGIRAEAMQVAFKRHGRLMRILAGVLMLALGLWLVFEIIQGTA